MWDEVTAGVAIPGVMSVAAEVSARRRPLRRHRSAAWPHDTSACLFHVVTPNYFQTLGIPTSAAEISLHPIVDVAGDAHNEVAARIIRGRRRSGDRTQREIVPIRVVGIVGNVH
jgi:hypothetical protein